MPEIKKTFTAGKMNKDLDERLVPNGEYRDALNAQVRTTDGDAAGVLQNIQGNALIATSTDQLDLLGDNKSKIIGSIGDEKNNKAYFFVSGNSIRELLNQYQSLSGIHYCIDTIMEVTTKSNNSQTIQSAPVVVDKWATIMPKASFISEVNQVTSEFQTLNVDDGELFRIGSIITGYNIEGAPMGRFSTDAEVGKQALQYPIRYINPKATEFKTRTLPVAGGAGLLAGVGGEDSGIGTESDASIIEDVNAETISIDDMTTEDLQALIKQRQDDAAAEAAKRERELKEGLETKRREALPDSARMLEDAMANVPENTTFQDYLSTLEGMEESRKGQVLMDLGASIANASHGGDIAKGFQEAGTKARAEKIEVAKERARVLGESRAMDINTSLKMAEIDAALMKSDQITLSGWLDLFADNPDLIESVEDADDPIAQMIKILSRLGVNTDNMEAIVEQTGTK